MATQFAPLTPAKLRDELLTHPLMLSIGSLGLSTFMSRSIFGVIDWRPVLICVASDILAIGMDHYFDQAPMLSYAFKTSNSEMVAIFRQAKMLLYSNAALLLLALSLSPPLTWAMVTVFFGPAFVWDFKLFVFGGTQKKTVEKKAPKNAFTIKRIPGMKAILIGVIRGCGTFAIVNSILARSFSAAPAGPSIWNPTQIIVWSTINRACHAVMADVRDFDEDWEKQVPTIPVLLKSVLRTKLLLTAVHLFTALLYSYNPYIVFASLYATVLVWALDEKSPRGLYRLSFHSQTLTAALYGAVEMVKWYTSYQAM
ncbi:hypothetical protein BD310DRAFT_834326 [Dichomitus squalens]|uniref:UbiA prenyltransferase family-domain-containing protein n=1 Tax=Dichomitus squalens TaxID=114155 RepID=A0A4V2K696_9APHY|nr:hypothetical protein BD310DRAFT_834326 [Dichomitus squalens]